MSNHMQEPWPEFVDICEPATPHPDSDGIVRLGFDDYLRAARCVNACRGVENNQLMVTSVSGAILMLREAQRQRDELLEALEAFSNYIHAEQCSTDGPVHYSDGQLTALAVMARKAIAKAKGGAA